MTSKLMKILNMQNDSEFNIDIAINRVEYMAHQITLVIVPTKKLITIKELNQWYESVSHKINMKKIHQSQFSTSKKINLFSKNEYFLWSPLIVFTEYTSENNKISLNKELNSINNFLDKNKKILKECDIQKVYFEDLPYRITNIDTFHMGSIKKEYRKEVRIYFEMNYKLYQRTIGNLYQIYQSGLSEKEINILFNNNIMERRDVKKQIKNKKNE